MTPVYEDRPIYSLLLEQLYPKTAIATLRLFEKLGRRWYSRKSTVMLEKGSGS
ncbi:hypothetical protein C8N40_109205 [Pontibacter mucosus]|uniref:Uncharacterized protein n=1 Tax=Pontibacter mucosus TaxID=1649266 RepID=A0A2T5YEI2_9BACT|nr:hypothetical protein C8N40_109205 [Pontibacter mucosus]